MKFIFAMNSKLRNATRDFLKATLKVALPVAERFTGFRTARGEYLRFRLEMLAGTYEAEEINLMQKFLTPGQVIVDVGANAGYLTRFFARSTGPGGKVLAFEPNPLIFPLLRQNMAQLPASHGFQLRPRFRGRRTSAVSGRQQPFGRFICQGISGHSSRFPRRPRGQFGPHTGRRRR